MNEQFCTPGVGAPAMYDYINTCNAMRSPSTVHCSNTSLAWFFRRYLMQKAMSVFTWELPKTWDRDYFLYSLYCWGFVAVLNTDKFGPIPQGCGLQGYNVFYRPARAIITNPLLKGMKSLEIGTQCTLIKLQPDYGGISDLVSYYGDMLALCAENAGVNLVNTKLAYVFACASKAASQTLKKMYDDIASGNPAVFPDKELFTADGKPSWVQFEQNLGQNFITPDVLSSMREIENQFCTAVGIPNSNLDKRERMITDEVNANTVETQTTAALWLQELQESVAATNDMFNLSISVDWRVKPETAQKPGEEGGPNESND